MPKKKSSNRSNIEKNESSPKNRKRKRDELNQSVSNEVDEDTIRNRKKIKPPKKKSKLNLIFDFFKIQDMLEIISRSEYKQLKRKPKKISSEEDKIRKRKKNWK